MKPGDNPRILAVQTLIRVLDHGDDMRGGPLAHDESRHGGFARHLSYGVLRWLGALEWLASQLLKRPMKKRDRDIQLLVLLGLFQLWKDDSAEYASVNETAECARILGKPWAVGLINAVLRRFQREKDDWLEKLALQDDQYAHPDWLLKALKSDWPQDWQRIVSANNTQAGLWLRINLSRVEISEVIKNLEQAGFETRRHEHARAALQVIPAAPVDALPGFREGHWSVQDPAAQLAVCWLEPLSGERILDACAAPGGKTCHILESVTDAQVIALDRSETRLKRLEENAERLGLGDRQNLTTITADALDTAQWWDGLDFDRILLDAPCTATGVIRRHPEIKWLRNPAQAQESAELQSRLISSLWPLLKPGGILVYATCSVLNVENRARINQFFENHDDARSASPEADYGHPSGHGCQILPGEADMDGFFYARLQKTSR